ncbi:ABC transporter permease [Arthrobacter sp. 2MCAF14]|uniref:ABC transporter permease n=1 Tax=Arthrobacter sp. 2MCAF14 TaxID=3232982 RepID=UPI003F913EE0
MTGALLPLGGFALFTAVLVAIGVFMSTAKEAGVVFGPLVALIFVPFYAISLILSDPHSPAVQAFTYFPFSAPVTAMLRNGFGRSAPRKPSLSSRNCSSSASWSCDWRSTFSATDPSSTPANSP